MVAGVIRKRARVIIRGSRSVHLAYGDKKTMRKVIGDASYSNATFCDETLLRESDYIETDKPLTCVKCRKQAIKILLEGAANVEDLANNLPDKDIRKVHAFLGIKKIDLLNCKLIKPTEEQ